LLKAPFKVDPSGESAEGPVIELLFFSMAAEKPAAQT
jgi:hypothetical protein